MTTPGFDLAKCVAFDMEVYPGGRWCVGFRGPGRDGEPTDKVVDGDRDELARVLVRVADKGRILVGYNSERFDVPLVRAILKGLDPYAPAQAIIRGEPLPVPLAKLPPLGCDHIDLAARLRRGGHFPSLKTVAANLGRPVLRELPYDPRAILDDEQWAEVIRYNAVDLGHTWALLEWFAPELQALAALSEDLGQDLRSTPTPRVVESVFLDAYRRERGSEPALPEPPREVLYRPVEGVVRPRTPAAAAWYDKVVGPPLPVVASGERRAVAVPRAHFTVGRLEISVGSGGLHSIDRPRVYYATRAHHLVSVDVASFYPSLIASKGITPRSYGACGHATYRSILERRLEVKRRAGATGDPAERARLGVQATALKLVLNSTFGKLGDAYSTLFDPAAFVAVTISGQLMLIDLIERLATAGARVLSANTDGLFLRARRGDRRWREALAAWQSDTAMELEVEPLKRLAILATNRYATLDRHGKIKRRGDGLKGSFSPLAAPNSLVVADAVAAALLEDVPPERTVRECADAVRFCRVTRRTGNVLEGVLRDDDGGTEDPLPKVTRWYKARDSSRRIVHRFADGRHTTPGHAVGVNLALDLPDAGVPDDLDLAWYMGQARKAVQAMPGYRHRSPKRLQAHPPALEAFGRGLVPLPKRGKAQPAGSDAGLPTFLYDWASYPTVGTYTGPAVAILAVDIDDAAKFRSRVDKGNSPLLANRWRDLDGALVSVRGDATAEQVRKGQARGKLLFRLEGDATHPLARIAAGRWQETWGVDVFYGKGLPSVLGTHPDGTTYRLEGTLGEAPGWLIDGLTPRRKLGEKPAACAAGNGHSGHWEMTVGSAPVDPEALEGLPKVLAGLSTELAKGSVGWRVKKLGDGRTIWVGRCPFEHESGTGTHGDLAAGYDAEGRPYVRCKHTSCTETPRISARLWGTHRAPREQPPEDAPPLELTEIARSMLEDLDGGRVALHLAPTGSGKSYSIALVAAERLRRGQLTLVALPTVRLAGEALERLRGFAPEAFAADAVAAIYGRRAKLTGDDTAGEADEEAEGDDDEGSYPIHDGTKIVVSTHAQLMRRGFSRFLRGLWEKVAHQEDRDGDETRAPFAIVVDEVVDLLRQCRLEVALEHRTRLRYEPDRSGGTHDPLRDCPKSNRSGNCANCRWVDHGGSPRFNRFQIRELRPVPPIETDADGRPLRTPRNPLKVEPADVAMGPKVRVGDTTFAAEVRAWKGRPIRPETRRTAPTFIFRREEGVAPHPHETPAEVLAHLLEFAHRPVMTWEYPVDSEGTRLDGELLAASIQAGVKDWDAGITFPLATCGVGHLLLTDLLCLEKLKRHAESEGVGLIFAGATMGPDDVEVLRDVWPDLADREHPYPDRRIRQVALAFPAGLHGIGSLVDGEGRLITHPLESIGLGLVFCPRKRSATTLFEYVADAHPTARLALENYEQVTTRKTLHAEGAVGTWLTYSRGVLGLGANVEGLRHLVVDAHAFRAIGSFTPGEITVEEFERARAEERTALILQNLGRALRGEAGKTVVLFVLNAHGIEDLLATSPAVVQGSDLPPIVARGDDLLQLVDQARRWLEAGGGDWPAADPDTRKPKHTAGRKPKKTRADILAAAEVAMTSGVSWRVFSQQHKPQRQLTPEEVVALKTRFKVKV